jgi:hypothetical protein
MMEPTTRRLYRLVEPVQLVADLEPVAAALDAAGSR